MSKITISSEQVIEQIKLSYQLPLVIEGIAARHIVNTMAEEKGLTAEVEELQKAADSIRLANKLYKPEDTWAWLDKHGLSLEEFEGLIRSQVLANKLAENLFSEQVEAFFFANKLEFIKAAVYEVVLDNQDLAMELFYALTEEEITFSEVARQYILNPEIRRVGGYRGLVNRRQLKAELSAAVFAANPPSILKPIMTSVGIHLIFVEEIIEPEFDEEFRQQLMGDLFSEWLKHQIAQLELIDRNKPLNNLAPTK